MKDLSRRLAVSFALTVFSLSTPITGKVIYVTTTGNDGNSGLSWSQAKRTVDSGLFIATAGDQVWVAAGTYNQGYAITIKTGLALYGGFAGTETDLSQRNWTANVTILYGSTGSVLMVDNGTDSMTRIDGFTIRNGTGRYAGSLSTGGGIYCFPNASPTICNNIFTNNSATWGGGIYCDNLSSAIISNNTFINNSVSGYGGGIGCYLASPTITNNTIKQNTAYWGGGGISFEMSNPIIVDNVICANTAMYGGGIVFFTASPTIVNNTISGNTGSTNGGGIYFTGASSPTLANNIVSFNTSGLCQVSGSGSPVLRSNCVYNPGGYNYASLPAGIGDISLDPLFTDRTAGNYHLTSNSPCIDAGNDAYVQTGWLDMDGAARINGSHVDIGADEYIGQGGDVVITSGQGYNYNSKTLSVSAKVIDLLYGDVTGGAMTWALCNSSGNPLDNGSMSYDTTLKLWTYSKVISAGLTPGTYSVNYAILTDRERAAQAKGTFMVGRVPATIGGTIKLARAGTPIDGASVALFNALPLWSLVVNQYGGNMPSLTTLLTQLAPLRGPDTTGPNGQFNWTNIPYGMTAIIVAEKANYLGNFSPSFLVKSADNITHDVTLAMDPGSTLAALLAPVADLNQACLNVLKYNAGIMGQTAAQAKSDNLYNNPDAASLFNNMAGWISVLNMGPNLITKMATGMTAEALTKAIVAQGLYNGIGKATRDEQMYYTNRVKNDLLNLAYPLDKLGFEGSEYHSLFANRLSASLDNFSSSAPTVLPNGQFNFGKATQLMSEAREALNKVAAGNTLLIADPIPDNDFHFLKLKTMTQSYRTLSTWNAWIGGATTFFSVVQVAGTTVTVISLTGGVTAPVGAAAATLTSGFGVVKFAAQELQLALKTQMAVTFINTLAGTYPEDNGFATEQFQSMLDLLYTESGNPYYLSDNNTFDGSADVNLNLSTISGFPYMFTLGLPGFGTAKVTATVTLNNSGNVPSKFRVAGYGVWSPSTLGIALGLEASEIVTSSDFKGPITIPKGKSSTTTLDFYGYSKNFLSQFKPHYLTVETYSGPWRVAPVTQPYLVFGLGKILSTVFLSGGMSMSAASPITQEEVLAPAANRDGQLSVTALMSQAASALPLGQWKLSAAYPISTVNYYPTQSLYAVDFRVFTPQSALVSILIMDPQGRRLGYSQMEGITCNELVGMVTDTGVQPISARIFQPQAGASYLVRISLLSPGPQSVPVELFVEEIATSNAVLTAFPSSTLLDGKAGDNLTLILRLSEASDQKALTGVMGRLSNLPKWNGSGALTVLDNQTKTVGNLLAGGQQQLSWTIAYPAKCKPAKYTGVIIVSSNQTANLFVPVVALVRGMTDTISVFEGPDNATQTPQKTLTFDDHGTAVTWVHVPTSVQVLHAAMGVVCGSGNLSNPSIDIGDDNTTDWAFSGIFSQMGVAVSNLEGGFNQYLAIHTPDAAGWNVPIRIWGTPGESIQLNGIMLYLASNLTGDCDGDGEVTSSDLAMVLAGMDLYQGHPDFDPRADMDSDGVISIMDLTIVITAMNGLVPGDCDGDGEVTSSDLAMVLAGMDLNQGEPGFDPRADLNTDGHITTVDLQIVSFNMDGAIISN